jgi:hypothetical protein
MHENNSLILTNHRLKSSEKNEHFIQLLLPSSIYVQDTAEETAPGEVDFQYFVSWKHLRVLFETNLRSLVSLQISDCRDVKQSGSEVYFFRNINWK